MVHLPPIMPARFKAGDENKGNDFDILIVTENKLFYK